MLPKEAKVPWQPAPVRWISSQITGLVSGTSWTEVGRLAIGQFWDGARTTNAFSADAAAVKQTRGQEETRPSRNAAKQQGDCARR